MIILWLLIIGIASIIYGIYLLGLTYTFKESNKHTKFFITCMIVILMIGSSFTTFAVILFQIENYFNIKIVW